MSSSYALLVMLTVASIVHIDCLPFNEGLDITTYSPSLESSEPSIPDLVTGLESDSEKTQSDPVVAETEKPVKLNERGKSGKRPVSRMWYCKRICVRPHCYRRCWWR
ncbi:unnamed protein product [Echinostoma caproni]|uniref:Hepcidin n=1 Tax=Echinostoma caproni TaxID=27848 RepID=A0A183AQ52_9TREM|nr:unnamed protein product [Echinostoma caproni]